MNESKKLRLTLSANIKKHRKLRGFSQEKLAEAADISANMMSDIEGCRTWVSDKTIVRLAAALHIEPYRLFVPETYTAEVEHNLSLQDILADLEKVIEKYRE